MNSHRYSPSSGLEFTLQRAKAKRNQVHSLFRSLSRANDANRREGGSLKMRADWRTKSLRACLKNGLLVARATRLFRPATRRTERERRFEPMVTVFSRSCSRQFRSAGRRPGRAGRLAGRPRHPFSKQAVREERKHFREIECRHQPPACSTRKIRLP